MKSLLLQFMPSVGSNKKWLQAVFSFLVFGILLSHSAFAEHTDIELECLARANAPWGESRLVKFTKSIDNVGRFPQWLGDISGYNVKLIAGEFYVSNPICDLCALIPLSESPISGKRAFFAGGISCTFK